MKSLIGIVPRAAISVKVYHMGVKALYRRDFSVRLKTGLIWLPYRQKFNGKMRFSDDEWSSKRWRTKDKLIADYALRDLNKPIGGSTYHLGKLPPELQAELPTVEQLHQALDLPEPDT